MIGVMHVLTIIQNDYCNTRSNNNSKWLVWYIFVIYRILNWHFRNTALRPKLSENYFSSIESIAITTEDPLKRSAEEKRRGRNVSSDSEEMGGSLFYWSRSGKGIHAQLKGKLVSWLVSVVHLMSGINCEAIRWLLSVVHLISGRSN